MPTTETEELECDYLVVGAGTAGMSFVDTTLAHNPSAKIVIVDRNSQPGGHWVNSYPFVRLHVGSCSYGVNSLRLGKNLDSSGNEIYDIHDRATGTEILEYYRKVGDQFLENGNVRFFFDAEYKYCEETKSHAIVATSNSGDTPESTSGYSNKTSGDVSGNASKTNKHKSTFHVKCGKLVTVATNVTVPSMRKPLIPVDESVTANFVPVNDLPSCSKSGRYSNYIVFGNGKTGVDAIAHLLLDLGIDRSQITWVISRDVWYMMRDRMEDIVETLFLFQSMVSENSIKDAFLALEKGGLLGRLDPKEPYPEVFKGANIDSKELDAMRSIENVVRLGRVKSIGSSQIVLDRGTIDFSPRDTLLVDCMVDKDYGYTFDDDFTIFEAGRINLGPYLSFYNPSVSSAIIAFLECTSFDGDDDDKSKNSHCYFLRGNYSEALPENLVGMMFMEAKTQRALMKVKGGGEFLMNSRTNQKSPMHHKGNMLRLLWYLLGPKRLYKFEGNLLEKVESKGYSDIDHCFGIEALEGWKANQQEKKSNERAGFFSRCYDSFAKMFSNE